MSDIYINFFFYDFLGLYLLVVCLEPEVQVEPEAGSGQAGQV